jgi:hypothetical protein
LLFTSSELERVATANGFSKPVAGVLGGMGGGVAQVLYLMQAYTTMGFCTFMKTVEVTRHRNPNAQSSTWNIAADILKREGIRGINKGVNAVALRQLTNWGGRLGISRITESVILKGSDRKLTTMERLSASIVGGALACWNQPIEVIRVEMQSQKVDPNRPAKMTISSTAKWIYKSNGFKGFYRVAFFNLGSYPKNRPFDISHSFDGFWRGQYQGLFCFKIKASEKQLPPFY